MGRQMRKDLGLHRDNRSGSRGVYGTNEEGYGLQRRLRGQRARGPASILEIAAGIPDPYH